MTNVHCRRLSQASELCRGLNDHCTGNTRVCEPGNRSQVDDIRHTTLRGRDSEVEILFNQVHPIGKFVGPTSQPTQRNAAVRMGWGVIAAEQTVKIVARMS